MTDLSPAANAVWEAFNEDGAGVFVDYGDKLAAALRAAANLLSQEVDAPKVDGSKYNGLWHSFDYLNAIAAELDGANTSTGDSDD